MRICPCQPGERMQGYELATFNSSGEPSAYWVLRQTSFHSSDLEDVQRGGTLSPLSWDNNLV